MLSALDGRVAPCVMDAYTAGMAIPSEWCVVLPSVSKSITDNSVTEFSPLPQIATRYVLLPLLTAAGWALAIMESRTGGTQMVDSFGRRQRRGDGGIDVMAWMESMALGDATPGVGSDIVEVHLKLSNMLRTLVDDGADDLESSPKRSHTPPRFGNDASANKRMRIIADDLARPVAIADDTMDAYIRVLRAECDPSAIQFVMCGESKVWAASRSLMRGEGALEAAYHTEVATRLAAAPLTFVPCHSGGHWNAVIVSQADATMYVVDSIHGSGAETGFISALRWSAPAVCEGMAVLRAATPAQRDGVSCGVFVVAFADALVEWVHRQPPKVALSECWRDLRVDPAATRRRMRTRVGLP